VLYEVFCTGVQFPSSPPKITTHTTALVVFLLYYTLVVLSMKGGKIIKNYSLKLKTVRKIKGLSQKELANLAETDQRVIYRYETGNTSPSIEKLVELTKILDVCLDDLIEFKKIHSEYSEKLKK
jgi:predicted transcriptional regulator